MRMTSQEYEALIRKYPHLEDRASTVCSPKQKRIKRKALERTIPREDKSLSRFKIRFTIYSIRPNDWDNAWTKSLQDCLVNSGILHDDAWNVLRGEVISEKVHRKEDEKTVIEIFNDK